MSEEVYKKIFSRNLLKYMNLKNKSQIDIVNDLGFNKSAVSTWCKGTRLPRMDKVDALAKYLGVMRSDLIEDKKESEQISYYIDDEAKEAADFLHKNPEYKVLFDASRKISKEDIDFVAKMLDKFRE